jgi:hypothetical protein
MNEDAAGHTSPVADGAVPSCGATSAPFSLSVITVTKGNASKQILAGANGLPIKGQGSLAISAGMIEHVRVPGLAGLQALLRDIRQNQVLVHGVVKGSVPGDVAPLVTKEFLKQAKTGTLAPGTVARSLECIAYPSELFLLMFDRDDNVEDPTKLTSADELFHLLAPLLPGMTEAGAVITRSASSAIRAKDTGEWLIPPSGFHAYFLARGNLERFLELLTIRLWNAGYGYCKLASENKQTGVASVLTRAVVDLAVYSAERLDYVAGARIAKNAPFTQDRAEPRLIEGGILDLDTLPAVTPEERREYTERLAVAKAAIAPERFQKVKAVIEAQEPAFTPAQVDALAHQRLAHHENRYLPPDFLLQFFHRKTTVRVEELSADFDGLRLADPAEPSYRDGTDAIFHWRRGEWIINSFAHGVMHPYRAVPAPPTDPDDDDMQDLLRRATEEAYQGRNGHTPLHDADDVSRWRDALLRTQSGEVKETYGNLVSALQHVPPWDTQCWYDVVREIPMCDTDALSDAMVGRAALDLERIVAIPIRNLRLVQAALVSLARQRPRDLLNEWLDSLPPWDKTERLAEWLHDYAHAEKDEYGMDVSRIIPVSMVARARNPGCQFRNVPIFEGPEDCGKSKLVKALAGPPWYRELSHGLEGKEAHMILQGIWVAELAELSTMRRTEENRLKSFITMQADDYIPKFSNLSVSRKRCTIFIGTVNPEGDGTYLKGQTGNTRYLPIRVNDINIADFEAQREQLFAQALLYYQEHPDDWWQLSTEGTEKARAQREERRQGSIYERTLGAWLEGKAFTTWEEIATGYLLLEHKDKWQDKMLQAEISKALHANGWRRKQRKLLKKNTWVWLPPPGVGTSVGSQGSQVQGEIV